MTETKPSKLAILIDNPKKDYISSLFNIVFSSFASRYTPIDNIMDLSSPVSNVMYKKNPELYRFIYSRFDTLDTNTSREELKKYGGIVGLGSKSKNILDLDTDYLQTSEWEGIPYLQMFSAFDLHDLYSQSFLPDKKMTLYTVVRRIFSFILFLDGFDVQKTDTVIEWVDTEVKLDKMVKTLSRCNHFAFDFETKPALKGLEKKKDIKDHSVNFYLSLPTVLSISYQPGHSFVIPLYHYESVTEVGGDNFNVSVQENTLFVNGNAKDSYDGSKFFRPTQQDLEKINLNVNSCLGGLNFIESVVVPKLNKVFDTPEIIKIAHNLKFDYKLLRHMGVTISGRMHDTLIMNHTLNELGSNGLKDLVDMYLPEFYGYGTDIDYANDRLDKLGYYAGNDTDLTLRLYYILLKKLMTTPRLYNVFRSLEVFKVQRLGELEYLGMEIDQDRLYKAIDRVSKLSQKIEMELSASKEIQKFVVNTNKDIKDKLIPQKLQKLNESKSKFIKSLEDHISKCKPGSKKLENYTKKLQLMLEDRYDHPDYPYKSVVSLKKSYDDLVSSVQYSNLNFKSPQQLQDFIYHSRHGLQNSMPVITRRERNPRTKRFTRVTGPYASTSKDDLSRLPDPTGILSKIVEFRSIGKMLSVYLEGMTDRLDSRSRVHTSMSTVKSQRISSRNPNLQQVPSRSPIESVKKIVKEIKSNFIPTKGWVMAQVDLSQAELRVYASLGNIHSMVEKYVQGKDLHCATAASTKGISYDDFFKLDKEEYSMLRYYAKAQNFGAIYKISASGLQEYARKGYGLDLDSDQSKYLLDSFLNSYPEIRYYHSSQIEMARKYGWVETGFGSRRNLPEIHSKNSEFRSASERAAINSPTQGTVGQMVLLSLIYVKHRLDIRGFSGKYNLLNTVHDSIILECHPDHAKEIFQIVIDSCNKPPMWEYFRFKLSCPMKSDIEVSLDSWAKLEEVDDLDKLEEVLYVNR